MNTRTIQKTGGSSYTITIPKEWMEAHHLSEKESLEYFFSPSGPICFRPTATRPIYKVSLEIDYLRHDHIAREIYGMYASGSEEITIHARNITHEQRAFIRALSYKLIGFEVFESTTHTMTLRNVSTSTISTQEYMGKIYSILLSMYDDAIISIKNKNIQLARDVIERDVEIDRIHMHISRKYHILLNNILPSNSETDTLSHMQYNTLVTIRLERIADLIARIAYSLLLLVPSETFVLNKFEQHTIESTAEYLVLLKEIIFSGNKRTAHKLLDMYHTYQEIELLKINTKDKPYSNIRIAESVERIRGYSANIAEETIDFSYMVA